MVVTRGNHIASFSALPSASTAIFFIAGFYLRSIKAFWFFYLLTVIIDLSTSYYRGQFGDCITSSYPMLVLSYGIIFSGGAWLSRARFSQPKHSQDWFNRLIVMCLVFIVVYSLAFFISNGSYYVFSGNFFPLSLTEYLTRVEKYYLGYLTTPIAYLGSACAMHLSFHYLTRLLTSEQAEATH